MILTVIRIEEDYWGRKRYLNVNTNSIYVLVDGVPHTTTDDGEPLYPVNEFVLEVVE